MIVDNIMYLCYLCCVKNLIKLLIKGFFDGIVVLVCPKKQ